LRERHPTSAGALSLVQKAENCLLLSGRKLGEINARKLFDSLRIGSEHLAVILKELNFRGHGEI
jgi:hypothetical protein